jgi:5-methylcytosine-specific restriction endonuclease McrA
VPYKDPEDQRAYGRDWIRRNAEKAREAMRRWRDAHPDEHNAERREYYARHREEQLAQSAQYHRDHPEVGRARGQNYRARKYAAAGSFTPAEWLELVALYGGRCAYCGSTDPLEADHRIPLARGGSNLIENILPACHSCNARKHLMSEAEFRARRASESTDDLQSTS